MSIGLPRLRRLLGTAAMVTPMVLNAQNHAIRFILPEFTSVYSGFSAFRPWVGGMGYEHRTRGGLTFGIDAAFTLFDMGSDIGGTRPANFMGHTAQYRVQPRSWAITYRAVYHVNGDGSGFYIGSFLGMRQARQQLELAYISNDHSGMGYRYFAHRAEADAMVFPIGMRLGISGDMDGWYGDLYAQLGYQIGAGDMDLPRTLSEAAHPLAGFTYTLGYAWGIGW